MGRPEGLVRGPALHLVLVVFRYSRCVAEHLPCCRQGSWWCNERVLVPCSLYDGATLPRTSGQRSPARLWVDIWVVWTCRLFRMMLLWTWVCRLHAKPAVVSLQSTTRRIAEPRGNELSEQLPRPISTAAVAPAPPRSSGFFTPSPTPALVCLRLARCL